MPNKLLSILALIATVGASVFGFLAVMDMMDGNMVHGSCVVSLLEGAVCPRDSGSFDSLNFHISFLQTFGLAILALAAGLFFVGAVLSGRIRWLSLKKLGDGMTNRLLIWSPNDSDYLRKFHRFINLHRANPTLA